MFTLYKLKNKYIYIYIYKNIQTIQTIRMLHINTVHVQRETLWVKKLAGEQCRIICSAWACKHTYIAESFVGLCTHSSVWKVSSVHRGECTRFLQVPLHTSHNGNPITHFIELICSSGPEQFFLSFLHNCPNCPISNAFFYTVTCSQNNPCWNVLHKQL